MKFLLVFALSLFLCSPLQLVSASPQRYKANAGRWPILGNGKEKPSAVRAIQYLLKAKGFNLVVDGRYGMQTRNQVKQFQRNWKTLEWLDNKTGVVDAPTWELLTLELKRGSHGWEVRAVQTLLCARGYKVTVDGKFGRQTERVVGQFKRQNCLTGVGMWTLPGVVESFTWCELVGGRPYRGLAADLGC